MKIAYLILAHNQPGRTACLAQTLASPGNDVYIHVDAKAALSGWECCKNGEKNIILINDRVSCCWGHFSLVKASLNLLREAYYSEHRYDYFILLSGQDYPIKPQGYISHFLSRHQGTDFIEYFSLPSEKLREKQGGLYRINRYHKVTENYHTEFPPYSKKPLFNALFNKWADIYSSIKRRMPLDMQPYAGSQWWMLTNRTAGILLHFLDSNPSVEKFFENVWIPDEIFYQTVIMHLKKEHNLSVINNNYRYAGWDESSGKGIFRPVTLCEKDFEKLVRSDDLFARKFDERTSDGLIKMLQKHIYS